MIAALAVLLAAGDAGADARVTGVVFEDLDRDGRRDAGEPGLPGVLVSNGSAVVATAGDGAYEIGLPERGHVFVVKPSDYQVPVSEDMLPRFYRRHDPEGTPAGLGLRYRGLEPSAPLPAALDFPLHRRPEPRRYSALLIADPQPQTGREVEYIRDDLLPEIIDSDALFGITVGDIMHDDLALIPRYNAIMAQAGIPWYNVAGNHELNFRAPDDAHSLETFQRFYGPPWYAFEVGGVLYVVLDNVYYEGTDQPIDIPNPRGMGRYRGHITATQIDWLAALLDHVPPERLVAVFMHIPLKATWEGDNLNTDNTAALLELLCARPHAVSFHGHTHTTEHHYLGAEYGCASREHHQQILTTVSGPWWSGPFDDRGIPVSEQYDGTPNGFHRLRIDGNRYEVDYVPQGFAPDHQLRIVLDTAFHRFHEGGIRDYRMGDLLRGPISLDEVHSTQLVVNLFDGGPRSRVWFRIGQRGESEMQRVFRKDPHNVELFLRTDLAKLDVKAAPSTHLWEADLPRDLEAGTHTVRVRAVDEFGRSHRGKMVLEVLSRR